ncbi:MAG: MBOAT family protein [bacterium]|nr:MBOAT family protein [bacterium]MCP4801160.1 MBOAT family protein [bacterium]
MLFNSHLFVFCFLPITLVAYYLISRVMSHRFSLVWLVFASLFYYAWWNPKYLILILGSIGFNYLFGRLIAQHSNRFLITIGVITNLGALAWFKYAGFLVQNLNVVADTNFHLQTIILPLAISFFTFQQISYLVDVYRGTEPVSNLLYYALFVSFFPQLIAGPIVHQQEMLPQFFKEQISKFSQEKFAVGMTLFFIGLFKKVVLADSVAVYASPVFEAADQGLVISFFEAWGGVLAYTYQIYFDFSGYSDMAIGLGCMFGIKLPINFDSPYQATNIIDFWRRWHMTLSRFLKHYLYFLLGGNRCGRNRRYFNLIVTMTLGGLWHGAGWNFIIWGVLHGLFLIINVIWRSWRSAKNRVVGKLEIWLGRVLTFVSVVMAWIFFRATSITGASGILKGATGQNGAILDDRLEPVLSWLSPVVQFEGTHAGYFNLYGVPWLIVLGLVCWFMPNPVRMMSRFRPALDIGTGFYDRVKTRFPEWQPNRRWAVVVAVLAVLAITHMARVSEFIYYQF